MAETAEMAEMAETAEMVETAEMAETAETEWEVSRKSNYGSVPYHINQHIHHSSTQCVKPRGAVLSYSHFFTDTVLPALRVEC